MRFWFRLLMLAVLALVSSITDAQAVDGKAVFKDKCVSCHGETGDGNGPASQYLNPRPRNLVTEKFKQGESSAEVFKTVTDGIAGTGMAPFKDQVSEDERKAVSEYVRSLRKKKSK